MQPGGSLRSEPNDPISEALESAVEAAEHAPCLGIDRGRLRHRRRSDDCDRVASPETTAHVARGAAVIVLLIAVVVLGLQNWKLVLDVVVAGVTSSGTRQPAARRCISTTSWRSPRPESAWRVGDGSPERLMTLPVSRVFPISSCGVGMRIDVFAVSFLCDRHLDSTRN